MAETIKTGIEVDRNLWSDVKRAHVRRKQSLMEWIAEAFRAALTRQALDEEAQSHEPKPAA